MPLQSLNAESEQYFCTTVHMNAWTLTSFTFEYEKYFTRFFRISEKALVVMCLHIISWTTMSLYIYNLRIHRTASIRTHRKKLIFAKVVFSLYLTSSRKISNFQNSATLQQCTGLIKLHAFCSTFRIYFAFSCSWHLFSDNIVFLFLVPIGLHRYTFSLQNSRNTPKFFPFYHIFLKSVLCP